MRVTERNIADVNWWMKYASVSRVMPSAFVKNVQKTAANVRSATRTAIILNLKPIYMNYSKKIVFGVMIIFSLVASVAFTEEPPPDDGEGGNAKYCRCRPNRDPEYPSDECVAGNYISFRPICQQGGGDCSQSNSNCF